MDLEMNAKIRREADRIIKQDLERTGGKWGPVVEAMLEGTRKAFENRALEKVSKVGRLER